MIIQRDYKTVFHNWYLKFKETKLFARMSETKESSSWHKEENVGVHTDMVVDAYMAYSCDKPWSKKDFLGAIHCAFHDTGKPMAEEITQRDDGTIRKKYAGHEIFSARLFVDYVYSDVELLRLLTDRDIYNIAVMIQSHIPYSLRSEKLKHLKTHLCTFGLATIFARCLLADTYGRISDDQETKRENTKTWIDDVFARLADDMILINERVPLVTLMCAPTGAGKTTIVNKLVASYDALGKRTSIHSLDRCRLDWYSSDYDEAFRLASDDPGFNDRAMKDYWTKAKENDVVIVDNTNISPKRRRRYIVPNTHAVVFMLDYETNCARLQGRKDKTIGKHVLDMMYWDFKLPVLGEVDRIFIVTKDGMESLC